MTDVTPQGQLNVCVDCYFMAVNGEAEGTPDREPWGLLQGEDVTPGVFEHDVYCPTTGPSPWDECHCEDAVFSWSPCLACGSTLGGDRFPMVWWG